MLFEWSKLHDMTKQPTTGSNLPFYGKVESPLDVGTATNNRRWSSSTSGGLFSFSSTSTPTSSSSSSSCFLSSLPSNNSSPQSPIESDLHQFNLTSASFNPFIIKVKLNKLQFFCCVQRTSVTLFPPVYFRYFYPNTLSRFHNK